MENPKQPDNSHYYFDDVVIDCDSFQVCKRDKPKSLTPRAFDLLVYLIKQRGRVVEKQEIFEAIWKETFVTDNALMRAVMEIRHELGDDANAPRYIETVHKRGYRFIAELKEASADAEMSEPPAPTEGFNPAELQISDNKTQNKNQTPEVESQIRNPKSAIEIGFWSLFPLLSWQSARVLFGFSAIETPDKSNQSPSCRFKMTAAARTLNICRTE